MSSLCPYSKLSPGKVCHSCWWAQRVEETISFDHEMMDGTPAARFTQRLKDLIESGYGLDDSTVGLEQAVAAGTAKKS